MDLFGSELVFPGVVGDVNVEIVARAKMSGSDFLPDELHGAARSGMLKYFEAIKDLHNIDTPEKLQRVLQEQHRGDRIMAKEDPRDNRPLICWNPGLTTVKRT